MYKSKKKHTLKEVFYLIISDYFCTVPNSKYIRK